MTWPNFFNPFCSSKQPSTEVTISFDAMRGLEDWPDNGTFELMIATKNGLPFHYFPIYHVAVAFRNPENTSYLVYGRQSPYDYSTWNLDGFNKQTKVINEKLYLNPEFTFKAVPTDVFFTKVEISTMLDLADEAINKKEPYSLLGSNCASYAVTTMSFALQSLLARPNLNTKDTTRLISMMDKEFLSNYFSPGVLNNPMVVEKIISALTAAQNHLLAINKTERLADETKLLEQVSSEIEKINYETETPRMCC